MRKQSGESRLWDFLEDSWPGFVKTKLNKIKKPVSLWKTKLRSGEIEEGYIKRDKIKVTNAKH